MIKTDIFILWSCIQNIVGIREYDFGLEHEYESLLEMSFTGLVHLINIRNKKLKPWTNLASTIL